MADDTPAPMPLFVVCRMTIIQGKASEAPASAFVPILPRKKPSKVTTATNATKLRMFGAASRNSVARIGPSRSSLVRVATGRAGGVAGAEAANAVGEIEMLWSVMGAPPYAGLEQRLRRTVFKSRAAALGARPLQRSARHYPWIAAVRNVSFLGRARENLINCGPS